MARNNIPERHAPETTTSAPLGAAAGPFEDPVAGQTEIGDNSGGYDATYDPPLESSDLDLDMFFRTDLDIDWQPAEMVVNAGMDNGGLQLWASTTQIGDFAFPFSET